MLSSWSELNTNSYLDERRLEYLKEYPGNHFAFPLNYDRNIVRAMGQFWRIPRSELSDFDIIFGGSSETFHAIQWGLVGSQSGGTWPTWFYEGEMVAIGRIMASPEIYQFQDYFKYFKYGMPYEGGSLKLSEMEDHIFTSVVYERGEDATYYLLGKYGWDKVLKFMSDKNSIVNWKTSFYNAFGVSYSDFYEDVQPFFIWMDTHRKMSN